MFGRRLSALALLLSCASAPGQASVAPTLNRDCWDRQELEALKVQRFKTMLLVAMLNCRDQEPTIAADYNRFVRANVRTAPRVGSTPIPRSRRRWATGIRTPTSIIAAAPPRPMMPAWRAMCPKLG
jgi:hypothetical protein